MIMVQPYYYNDVFPEIIAEMINEMLSLAVENILLKQEIARLLELL